MIYTKELKTKMNNDEFSLLLAEYKKTNNPAVRDEIIIGSQAFIKSIASRYIRLNQTSSLDIDDLICEGTIGLISAIDKYDLSSGVKFTTYANYWINQAIQRSIYSTDKLIRYPENVEVDLIKYNKKINDSLMNGETLNFSTDEETLRELYDQRHFVYSLSVETDTDSDESMVDHYLEDENANIEDDVIKEQTREKFNALMYDHIDRFSKRRAKSSDMVNKRKTIIYHWFGLGSYERLDLTQIATIYGDSRQNINQIIKRFIKYTKDTFGERALREYYNELVS